MKDVRKKVGHKDEYQIHLKVSPQNRYSSGQENRSSNEQIDPRLPFWRKIYEKKFRGK